MNTSLVEKEKLREKVQHSCKLTVEQEVANTQQVTSNMLSKKNTSQPHNFQDFPHLIDRADEETSNGRISRISNESAFSSTSESGEDYSHLNNNIDLSASSSCRSSMVTSRLLECGVKLDGVIDDLCSKDSGAVSLIETIRLRFLENLKKEKDLEELYDRTDLAELEESISKFTWKEQSLAFRLISRYVKADQILDNQDNEQREKIIKEVTEKVKELLKFRKRFQIPTTLAEHFCKEYFLLEGVFSVGHDKNELPVLYIRARVHRKWSSNFDASFRRYVAWQVNQLTKSYREAQVAKSIGRSGLEKDGSFSICFDCYNISYSCLDMDFLKFLVQLFVNYYPSYCRHVWVTDLPWLFRSVYRLVKTWLPEDSKVQLITSKELDNFIGEDQKPNCMRTSDQKSREKPVDNSELTFPKNFISLRGLDELGIDLDLNPNEVKQFRAHFEKMRKEYN